MEMMLCCLKKSYLTVDTIIFYPFHFSIMFLLLIPITFFRVILSSFRWIVNDKWYHVINNACMAFMISWYMIYISHLHRICRAFSVSWYIHFIYYSLISKCLLSYFPSGLRWGSRSFRRENVATTDLRNRGQKTRTSQMRCSQHATLF